PAFRWRSVHGGGSSSRCLRFPFSSCASLTRKKCCLANSKATRPMRETCATGWCREFGEVRSPLAVSSKSCPGETVMPGTVRLHRVLATKPEKIYRAFVEADALAKWLPPNGFVCTVHHLEPQVGGTFKMSFRNFTTGKSHAFGGRYVELVPGERLRYTDKFDDPDLPGEIEVTMMLKKTSVGTELDIVLAGIPDVIPPEACYLGWQESLRNLA